MLTLALRNVGRHATHTVVLAGLIALATALFVVGNSFLSSSDETLRELFVRTITGDFVVVSRSAEDMSLFGSTTPAIGEFVPVPTLSGAEDLVAELGQSDGVELSTPLVFTAAALDAGGRRSTVPLFGIEPDGYHRVLSALELVDGRRLRNGEAGALITDAQRRRIDQDRDTPLQIGDEILLTTGQGQRFRIRGVPLVGTFRYPLSVEYVDEIVLVDISTARALSSIQERVVSPDADDTGGTGPRSAAEVDSLFAEAPEASDAPGETAQDERSTESVLERVQRELGGDSEAAAGAEGAEDAGEARTGAVHFLLVRGERTPAVEETVADAGGRILSWRQAAGQPALLALLLQVIFNGGFVLFIVAVTLAAINVVLISTYRRSREIATLRAIGIDDGRVRGVFVIEHGVIALIGWLLGVLAAFAVSLVVSRLELTVGNRLLALLFGGSTVVMPIRPGTAAVSLLVTALVVGVSVLVPVSRVMRRPIVEAIQERR